jgi:hypothetical protein
MGESIRLSSPSSLFVYNMSVHKMEVPVPVKDRRVSSKMRHAVAFGSETRSSAVDNGQFGPLSSQSRRSTHKKNSGKNIPESSKRGTVYATRPDTLHILPLLRLGLIFGKALLLEENVGSVEHFTIATLIGTRSSTEALQLCALQRLSFIRSMQLGIEVPTELCLSVLGLTKVRRDLPSHIRACVVAGTLPVASPGSSISRKSPGPSGAPPPPPLLATALALAPGLA